MNRGPERRATMNVKRLRMPAKPRAAKVRRLRPADRF
jgi:hypothetical protein